MKIKVLILFFVICMFESCYLLVNFLSPNADFTNKYTGKYTGLDTLIFINGFYMCNEPVYSLKVPYYYSIMFYKDGLVCSTSDNPINVFKNGTNPTITWGTYKLSGDTIICQFIGENKVQIKIEVSESSYLIQSENKLLKIAGSNTGTTYSFHPLENRIDSTNWLLKKGWFYEKKKSKN